MSKKLLKIQFQTLLFRLKTSNILNGEKTVMAGGLKRKVILRRSMK